MSTKMFRQGDILLVKVEEIPSEAKKSRDHILAYGEVTGHSHRIQGTVQVFRRPRQNQRQDDHTPDDIFLEVTSAELVHDEHGPIQIPKGLYRVQRQREYDPFFSRLVQD